VEAWRNIPAEAAGSLSNVEHSCTISREHGTSVGVKWELRILRGWQMSDEKESLVGRRVRFRPDFYTTRLMPPRDWTGTIELERRSSSEEGRTSYIVLLNEPFRSQEQNPRVDTTEDEMEPF
jgi:hypothetical protein